MMYFKAACVYVAPVSLGSLGMHSTLQRGVILTRQVLVGPTPIPVSDARGRMGHTAINFGWDERTAALETSVGRKPQTFIFFHDYVYSCTAKC